MQAPCDAPSDWGYLQMEGNRRIKEHRYLAVLVAVGMILGGAISALAQDPLSEPPDARLIVDISKTSYEAGEGVVAKVYLWNNGTTHLSLSRLNWETTVYRINTTGATHLDPILHAGTTSDQHSIESIPPGGTLMLQNNTQIWNQSLHDGSQARHGAYVYAVQMVDIPDKIQGFQVFAIGASSLDSMPGGETLAMLVTDSDQAAFQERSTISSTGGSAGYGFFYPRWYTMPVSWRYNPTDEPNLSGVLTAVQNSFDNWEDDGGSYLDFDYDGTTSKRSDNQDDTNTVDWRAGYLPASTIARVDWWAFASDSNRLYEADLTFNADLTWSTSGQNGDYDVENVGTHEVGHWIRLKNLFNPGHSDYESWMGSNNEDMTMYGLIDTGKTKKRSLEWGDLSGVRYAYAHSHAGPSSIGDSTAGAGAEIHDVNDGGVEDLVVSWVDDPSGGNSIKYEVGWTIDSSTGKASSWSGTKTAASNIGDSTQGHGVTMANLDGNSNPEMVVVWVDNPSGANSLKYKVGWNIDTSGDASSWSGTKTAASSIGDETQGAGACLTNIDGTSNPELVVLWVDNPSGANSLKYKVGFNIDSSGDAASWSSTKTQGQIGDETQGAGVACTDLDENGSPDFVFGWNDNPSGDNKMLYRVGLNPDSNGDVSSWSNEEGPGANQGIGHESQGLGMGAGEVDGAGIDEMAFVYVNNPAGSNSAHYREEWNGRYDSHD